MDELEQPAGLPDSDAAAQSAAAEEHEHEAEQHDDHADPDSEEQPEEDEEIEIGGKKVAMPQSIAAEIKAGMMRNADYTQKTQAVAEQRKAIEAEREQVRQQAEQHQQYAKELSTVHALDERLAEFKQVDWQALSREDPALAQQLRFQYDDLQQKRNEAVTAVTQKQQQLALAEQQATAKQVQEAEAYVQREIPGWTKEAGAELNSWAQAKGVKLDQTFAKAVIANPALIVMMNKARMLEQLEAKQSAKPKPAPPPAPVTRVSASRATAAKDLSKVSDADWYRAEQERKRKR